jgi:hypothetical protein
VIAGCSINVEFRQGDVRGIRAKQNTEQPVSRS